MGHYDNCRDGYCAACGAAPGNFIKGVCQFCKIKGTQNKPSQPAKIKPKKKGKK